MANCCEDFDIPETSGDKDSLVSVIMVVMVISSVINIIHLGVDILSKTILVFQTSIVHCIEVEILIIVFQGEKEKV